MFDVDRYLSVLRSEKLKRAVNIQNEIIQSSRDFLRQQGFVEILPVIISPITDPLTDYRIRGEIECYGFTYQITKSMIFHKQISLHSLARIFSFSPNIRIEPSERQESGKHLVEFVQLDLEVRDASREDVVKLGEELLIFVLEHIKADCREDLEFFKRDLKIPKAPFPSLSHEEALQAFGKDYEAPLSRRLEEPLWLLDFPMDEREFYDREYPDRAGILKDMDLIYPEGYGEALSGGEREFEPEKIKKRIELKGIDLRSYDIYLKFAEKGLFPSAGFGIGVERLTRYICGLERIEETRLFAKLPGILGL
ncbi:MAG: asparagine synthetase A [Clostridiales bacterium]|nr:asparagine synthetase A [Clostridiales bacterium]